MKRQPQGFIRMDSSDGSIARLHSRRRFLERAAIFILAAASFVAGVARASDSVRPSQPMRIAQMLPFSFFGDGDSKSPRPITVAIGASSDINPGPSANAAPVSVQVFMLRSTGRFQTLDYFQLRDGAANALGSDLIDRQSISVTPGGSASVSLNTAAVGQAGYVGVIAGFRQIDNAQWRAVTTVSPGSSVQVSLSRLSVSAISASGR
jgi:type VI secretion system VasD/TssJ family lipoprotein